MKTDEVMGSVEFYDKLWSEDWGDMERFNPTARHLERMIVRLIKQALPVSSILDVGCGMGVNIKRIRKHFPEVRITGSDLSPSILKIAEEYVGKDTKIDYACLDAAKGVLNRKFDLVLCSQVLEHIQDDRAAMRNLAAMTSKYLLITVPSGAYNSTSKINGHVRHYTVPDLMEKVREAGVETITLREWGFPFHSMYKWLLGRLPEESQKMVGLGEYSLLKRTVSHILYGLFFGNVFNAGANIMVLSRVL